MKKEELRKAIEEIEITYDYTETYNNLYNTCIDYMNETQDFNLEYLFENYFYSDTVEEIVKQEIEKGGLERLRYFINDCDLSSDLFIINAYGNLENVLKEDLENLKEEILYNL